MPIILIGAIRLIIQAAVQLGIWSLVEKYAMPLLDQGIIALAKAFGLSDQEATDFAANEFLQMAESVGVFALTLKTRLPSKVADRLGFTTKGFQKRKLSTKAGRVPTAATTAKVTTKFLSSADISAAATAIAKGTGKNLGTVKSLLGIIATVVGIPTAFFFAAAQYIDFANWQGPYQGTFQKLLSKVGINPDTPLPKAGAVSDEIWKKIYTVVEELKPSGMAFPTSGEDRPYSRANLAALVNEVSAGILAEGGEASFKNVFGIVLPLLQNIKTPSGTSAATGSAPSYTATPSVPSTKVFIGAVGGGTLSSASEFTPRQDDLIVSMEEAEAALRNNLTNYAASILGRFVYETKVVSSVTTRDGFTQRGQPQQVVSGYKTDGTPKYRTVINKFLVADVYFVTRRGTRTKDDRIVLGPTDAVKFQPTGDALARLDLDIRKDLYTTSLSDVSEVKQGSSTTTLSKPDEQTLASATFEKASSVALGRLFRAGAANGNPGPDQLYADTGQKLYILPNTAVVGAGIYDSADEYARIHGQGKHYETVRERLKERYGINFDALPARNPADLEVYALQSGYQTQAQYDPGRGNVQNPLYAATSVAELLTFAEGADVSRPIGQGPACAAENLSAFYAARGETLPSVEVRSVLYEQYGLGPRGFYTGTGEQNAKLLSKLKAQAGCSI